MRIASNPNSMSWLSRIFGDASSRHVKRLSALVERINALESSMQSLSAEDLRGLTQKFRDRIQAGETLDDVLPEAFAAVREASRRANGKRHFDVQLMGGMVLHEGKIAQMGTGEGKTLVATLAAYLRALAGKGVHVVTVNDYLSRRDTAWMGQIYHALGMTVGCLNSQASYMYDPAHIPPEQSEALDAERDQLGAFRVVHEFLRPVERVQAYEADITYGTNNEFGFDYLRDNMAMTQEGIVQRRGHYFAIVDEVDSILIDEARTPLIISAPDEESGDLYRQFARVVPHLSEGTDYNVDEKLRAVSLTDAGIDKVQERMKLGNLYEDTGVRHVHALEKALAAHVLYKKDDHYVVKDGEVIIVDEFTGRLMPGRRWSDGLHQAVEAKEGVEVQRESRTLATVTFQNYFRLYATLSGMTGTAQSSAEEFHKVYGLDVVAVPPNRPLARVDQTDRMYKTEAGKLKALVNEIKERSAKGQPVLVGTVSIAKNEILSLMLTRAGVQHQVLNAKNHEREAEIIAQAGRRGAVTVATNMAGRGVDIILGGNPPDPEEAEAVRQAGGLAVFGTERHEARRIDNQLRGRAGRQGDKGLSLFYVSMEDDLMRIFGGDRIKGLMDRLGVSDDDVIEHSMAARSIEQAQERIEGHNFDSRKHVLEYDDVMNKHRQALYGLRREVLFADSCADRIVEALNQTTEAIVRGHVSVETGALDVEEVSEVMRTMAPFDASISQEIRTVVSDVSDPAGAVIGLLQKRIEEIYARHESDMGLPEMRNLERLVYLRTIDDVWVGHLSAMENLRDSVNLRAYGQRDPLVEYKIEAQRLFASLLDTVRMRVAQSIFKVRLVAPPVATPVREVSGAPSESPVPVAGADTVVGRNDPCPCGSGKKYKKCHGK